MDAGGNTDNRAAQQAMLAGLDEYIAAIDTARRRLSPYLTASSVLALLIAAGLLLLSVRLYLLKNQWLFILFPLCLGLVLALSALSALGLRLPGMQGRQYPAQLDSSALARRLALGELDNDACIEHTPAYLRWMWPRPQRDKAEILIRISANPAWFLAPPRLHVRPIYNMLIIPLCLFIIILFNMAVMSTFGGRLNPFIFLIIPIFLSAFNVLDAALKRENLWQLERHLIDSRNELQGEIAKEDFSSGSEVELRATPAAIRRATSLHLILNQFEQDMLTARVNLLIIPMQTAGLLCFAPMMTSGQPMAFALVLLTALTVSFLVVRPWDRMYREELREKLAHSGLAILLASGDVKDDGIFEHTPPMLRWFLHFPRKPKSYADQLQSLLWRAAFNLEFYLDRPVLYYRVSWLLSIAAVLLIALNLGRFLSVFVSGTYISMDSSRAFLFCSGLVLGIWLGREVWKQIINAAELLRYLREHLDS